MTYTPEVIAYIQAHFNVDMTGAQIAKHLGVNANTLRQHVTRLRARGIPITEKIVPPGTLREINQGKRGSVIREKQADGSWKFVRYVRSPQQDDGTVPGYLRKKQIGTITERTSGGTFIKTESGWKHLYKQKQEKCKGARVKSATSRPLRKKASKAPMQAGKVANTAPIRNTDKYRPVHEPAFRNNANPEHVQIKMQAGGSWIWDAAKRGYVYRKNQAA